MQSQTPFDVFCLYENKLTFSLKLFPLRHICAQNTDPTEKNYLRPKKKEAQTIKKQVNNVKPKK